MTKYYRDGQRSNYRGKSKNFDPDFYQNRRLGIRGPNGKYHPYEFSHLGNDSNAPSGEGLVGCFFWIVLIAFGLYWYFTSDSRLNTKIEENAQQIKQVLQEKKEVEIQLELARKEQGWLRRTFNDTDEVDRLEAEQGKLARESQRLHDSQQDLAAEKDSRAEKEAD